MHINLRKTDIGSVWVEILLPKGRMDLIVTGSNTLANALSNFLTSFDLKHLIEIYRKASVITWAPFVHAKKRSFWINKCKSIRILSVKQYGKKGFDQNEQET